MFPVFFNEPLLLWRSADLVFASGWSLKALVFAWIVALLVIVATLWTVKLSIFRRSLLGVCQIIVAWVALLMLWQPALRTEVMQPGDNVVAFVLDGSRSMHFTDGGNAASRIDQATKALNNDSLLRNPLFDASLHLLTDSVSPLKSLDHLPAPGVRTALADGLLNLIESVNERSVAAVVLMSDGANNVGTLSTAWWQRLRAAGIPVHTVGIGPLVIANDIELADVSMDSSVSANTSVSARIRILHDQGGIARLRVTSGDELLAAENIPLDEDGQETRHVLVFDSGDAGMRELVFTVQSDSTDVNKVNNSQPRVLQVLDKRKRILYVEGEPRWEYKFLRRAIQGFPGIELVSLLRTSPNKFYRQGVRDANELADGFPGTRAALFAYDAVIIGSLDAAQLNIDQQANLRDFVSVRGGSLLMLAGLHGLSDGGWGRSAVSAALPVILDTRSNIPAYQRLRTSVELTQQGERTKWLQFEENATANSAAWNALPDLADMQAIGRPKAGSVVLLTTRQDDRSAPLLVWQNYGQGQSYVMGTSGTWRWQMRMPSENQQHEQFWQQFLSHIVASALPQVAVASQQQIYRDTAEVELAVTVRDADYSPVTGATLPVDITLPDGERRTLRLTSDIKHPGRFTGTLATADDGAYALTVTAPVSGEVPMTNDAASVQRWWVNESGTAEYFSAAQNEVLMRRLAEETGGKYISIAELRNLPTLLAGSNATLTQEETRALWNMPVFFFSCTIAGQDN